MADIFELFKKIAREPDAQKISYMVVGLGNPGRKYERTRHNAGFMAIEFAARKYGAVINSSKFDALVGEAQIAGKRVLLIKPQTFMNLSGVSVAKAAKFYKISMENIIVLLDDIYLEPARLRVRRDGSPGGHRGLESIEMQLGGNTYPRIKIGVGQKPREDYELADWVLSEFSPEEMKKLEAAFPVVCEGLEAIISGDIEKAMQICGSHR